MPVAITYKDYQTYLLLEVTGPGNTEFVLSEGQKVWKRMSELCQEMGRNRALLVLNLQKHIHIGMSMDLARLAEENGWEREYRLGIVSNLQNRMTMDLMKSFLIHRGFETEVFDNLRLARRWLIH